MPFKHKVIDSRDQEHTRVSQERQYPFAVVTHLDEYHSNSGMIWKARSFAQWCSRRDLANKTLKAATKYWGFREAEIIECTPIATGRHA